MRGRHGKSRLLQRMHRQFSAMLSASEASQSLQRGSSLDSEGQMVSFHLANLRTVLQVRNSWCYRYFFSLVGFACAFARLFMTVSPATHPVMAPKMIPPNSTRGEMPPPTARNI